MLIRAFSQKKQDIPEKLYNDKDFITDGKRYEQTLSKMISHETISTEDNTYIAEIEKLHEYLKERFPLIENTCEWKNIDGGLLIKWTGRSEIRPLLLMSHLDVVPAKGEWTKPAFSGDIEDGIIWGRGAVDTKGSLCAIFEAVESLLQEDYKPDCDLYIFASSREEIAGEDAAKAAAFLKENGIAPRLVIDEGGAIIDNPMAGVTGRFGMIAMSEKSSAKILLTAGRKSNESGMQRLARFVLKMKKIKLSDYNLAPEVKAMFSELTPSMSFGLRFIFSNLWLFKSLILNLLPKFSSEAAGMIGATVSFSNLTGADADKLPIGTCGMNATIAGTYHQDIRKCTTGFIKHAEKAGLSAKLSLIRETVKPEPVGSSGYNYVADTIRKVFENVRPSPFIIFGGTDARAFVDVSESVIRFVPLHFTKEELSSVHSPNEHVHSTSLCGGVRFYREAIKNISDL